MVNKRELYEALQVIRIEIMQLDYKKDRWIANGWFDKEFKKKYTKRKKELSKQLDEIEKRIYALRG